MKDFGLEIVAEYNSRVVNYVDLTLKLNDSFFRPCHKPDDIIQHMNKKCNHPPNLTKHLSASIEKRLSNNSSDENFFKEARIHYEETLNKACYINKLVYHAPRAISQEH